MTGIMKAQIDWIPLAMGRCQTQGKTLAVMQVSGGSQWFNALNQLRIFGRSMRMLTIPNQSSVPKPFFEFTEEGRMTPLACYDRIVDVMEKLFKFTLLKPKESAAELRTASTSAPCNESAAPRQHLVTLAGLAQLADFCSCG
jgi:arsenical resistance protein ArsH